MEAMAHLVLMKHVRKTKHMTRWEILTFETIDLILDYHRFEGYGLVDI
jgi:hypothetical protein